MENKSTNDEKKILILPKMFRPILPDLCLFGINHKSLWSEFDLKVTWFQELIEETHSDTCICRTLFGFQIHYLLSLQQLIWMAFQYLSWEAKGSNVSGQNTGNGKWGDISIKYLSLFFSLLIEFYPPAYITKILLFNFVSIFTHGHTSYILGLTNFIVCTCAPLLSIPFKKNRIKVKLINYKRILNLLYFKDNNTYSTFSIIGYTLPEA